VDYHHAALHRAVHSDLKTEHHDLRVLGRLAAAEQRQLAITGTAGLVLLVYHAEPDSPSAQGLALLANLVDQRTGLDERNVAVDRAMHSGASLTIN
jgi:hypothetical protein